MKNSNKTIVASLTGLLAVAAVGTTFAVYKSVPNAQTITISSTVKETADAGFEFNGLTVGNKAMPGTPQTIDFKIHGYKTTDSAFDQPYVMANLKVTISVDVASFTDSNITVANFLDCLAPSLQIVYKDGTYFSTDSGQNSITNWTIDSGAGTITGDVTTYIYMAQSQYVADTNNTFSVAPGEDGIADHNPVHLTIGLDDAKVDALTAGTEGDADIAFVTYLAEKNYTVSLELCEGNKNRTVADENYYDYAFITGGMNGWVTDTIADEYTMVANIEAVDKYEWMWLGQLPENTEFKCVSTNGTWPADPNSVATSTMLGVYWDGSNTSNATIGEPQP